MIWFVLFVAIVSIGSWMGGATWGFPWPTKREPVQVAAPAPKRTVPIANVISMAEWKRLEIPAARRRGRN